ncbi:MAG: hypothetical protein V3R41_06425, partial [Gammaproteobacteria bacterium]
MPVIEFLQQWSNHCLLTAILPDGGTESASFDTFNDMEAIQEWVEKRDDIKNLYFSVNEVTPGLSKKAGKSDLKALRCLHVDIDPEPDTNGRLGPEQMDKERDRILNVLRKFKPTPSIVLDSGGGYQAFWLLREPIQIRDVKHIEELEESNRWLETELQGDHCHNLDRILRLPFTTNIPNKKKRDAGRAKTQSSILYSDWAREYNITDFGRIAAGEAIGGGSGKKKAVTLRSLRTSKYIKDLIKNGDDKKEPFNDRSAVLWIVLKALVKAHIGDNVVLGVITDPANKISESVLENSNPMRYASRQLKKAQDEVGVLFKYNKEGAILLTPGNIRLALKEMEYDLTLDLLNDRVAINGRPIQSDRDVTSMWLNIDQEYDGFLPKYELFTKVLEDEAMANSFHPIHDYLDGLKWDGE